MPVWTFGGSPYVGAGPNLYLVVETDDDKPPRLLRGVGGFDTIDRAEQWAEEYLAGSYAVIPFEIAPGEDTEDVAADEETAADRNTQA